MLKLLSLGAAFAAGAVVANGEIRQGIRVTAADTLNSTAAIVRPEEENGAPMGGPYGIRSYEAPASVNNTPEGPTAAAN